MNTLAASTRPIKSGSAGDDSIYTAISAQINSLTTQRDAVASQMRDQLDAAAFDGQVIDEQQAKELIVQGQDLLAQVVAVNP
jgi:hypothetical protein